MAVLLQLHLLKCFPSQMTCNNPRVLPWGHFPVGCVLNRLQRAIFSGCCSCSLCISQFFGSLVPSWCDLDKILPITPFSGFICSDWHARFWEVRPTRFSLFRGRITIAFLSVWQKEPRQCDVSVCRRYLSKQQRKLCFISGSIKQYPTNSNSLLLVWWVCVHVCYSWTHKVRTSIHTCKFLLLWGAVCWWQKQHGGVWYRPGSCVILCCCVFRWFQSVLCFPLCLAVASRVSVACKVIIETIKPASFVFRTQQNMCIHQWFPLWDTQTLMMGALIIWLLVLWYVCRIDFQNRYWI